MAHFRSKNKAMGNVLDLDSGDSCVFLTFPRILG